MAMIPGFFVSRYLGKLADFVEGEICKVLGVKEEITTLQRRLRRIAAFVQDAEQKRRDSVLIDEWVRELKDVMYDADDIIDLCNFEGGKLLEARPSSSASAVSFSVLTSCFGCIKFRHDIARRIEALNGRLKQLAEDNSIIPMLEQRGQQPPQTYKTISRDTSHLEDPEIVGEQIEEATEKLISLMTKNNNRNCRFFGIVGMGGIGKTTLARKIFNDERINENFPFRKWLYISKDYIDKEIDLLKELIRWAGEKSEAEPIQGNSREELEPQLASLLVNNYILVLDDVWGTTVWTDLLKKPIVNGKAKGTILVTTRDETVVKGMIPNIYNHLVEKLDEESGWKLLRGLVFDAEEEYEIAGLKQIGMDIVRKCDGLPLSIKAIAGVLTPRERTEAEWKKVLESDAWSMNEIHGEVPRALYLSYEDLPSHLKQCFLYCSLCCAREKIYYGDIVRIWIAEGLIVEQENRLLEDLGVDYYWELVRRNLLQVDPTSVVREEFSMHDHLRSLGANLMKEECISVRHGQILNTNIKTKIRRLLVANVGSKLVLPDQIMQEKCLRTLILRASSQTETIEDDVLRSLPRLRVLDLSVTSIERIPDCIGDLLHLRYLELCNTNIHEIPESLERLANLQTLDLFRCSYLRRLPKAITRLYNLRCINIERTSITQVPKGIGKLKKLSSLEGFIIGHGSRNSELDEGCDLEELQSLSNLIDLCIYNLKRAVGGASALAEKPFLKNLVLSWKLPAPDGDQDGDNNGATWSEEQIQRAEMIFNTLFPPSSLQLLVIKHFPGRQCPRWMISTNSMCESFPNLAYLKLLFIPSCKELPPLGVLPQLKYLSIAGARAIRTIGPEFLGRGFPRVPAFPRLEKLEFLDMPNWEEWSLCEAEIVGHGTNFKLFPNLKECNLLDDCPKLRALPQGLSHASYLKVLRLRGTYCLREITNLPLTYKLEVTDNKMLKRISDLSTVKYLEIDNCPNVEYVENLDNLRHLELVCPLQMEQLPPWLSGLIQQRQKSTSSSAQCSFRRFEMRCGLPLLMSCLEGSQNWLILKQIPEVKIRSYSGEEYIRYTMDPYMYDTNVHPE